MRKGIMLVCRSVAAAVALAVAPQTPAGAQQASTVDFDQTAAAQAAANSKPGPRVSPARTLPLPTADVSPELQDAIAAPYSPIFAVKPKSTAEWNAFIAL